MKDDYVLLSDWWYYITMQRLILYSSSIEVLLLVDLDIIDFVWSGGFNNISDAKKHTIHYYLGALHADFVNTY